MKYFFCKTKSGEDYDNPQLSRFHFDDQTDQIDVVSTVDVLAGAEIIEAEGELEFKNFAILAEMKVFVKDGYFCLFDGEETYGFSLKKVAGIRKINQGIPIEGWNKKDPPYAKMFQNDGLLLWNKSPVGLKYFYALEVLLHDGIHRLLFPAYELHRIKRMIPKKDIIENGGSHQEKVRPVYYWKMPKNAGYFFTHQSDVVFKEKHPVAFKVLAAVGVVVSLLPLTLFIVIGALFFHQEAKDRWWL